MKKLFLMFIAAIMAFNVNAAITNLEIEVDSTNADFYWQGDTTVSKIYEIDLLEANEFGYIAAGAWYSTVFDLGYNGWMWMSSDLLLAYGQNYVDLESAGASASVVAAWKANWEAAVDTVGTDVTLKPGTYVVVIEGYDANYDQVTEEMAYEFFEIANTATDENELIQVENKSKKFIDPKGRFVIYSNGDFYDQLGRKIGK